MYVYINELPFYIEMQCRICPLIYYVLLAIYIYSNDQINIIYAICINKSTKGVNIIIKYRSYTLTEEL